MRNPWLKKNPWLSMWMSGLTRYSGPPELGHGRSEATGRRRDVQRALARHTLLDVRHGDAAKAQEV